MSEAQPLAFPDGLERYERDLLESIENATIGLLITDDQRRVAYANPRLLEWLQYEEQELLGKASEILIPEEMRGDELENARRALERGDLRARLIVLQRKDSTTFPAIWIGQPRRNPLGEIRLGISLIIELATVQTARPLGTSQSYLAPALNRIAMELQFLSMNAPTSISSALTSPVLNPLTPRERQVLELLMTGERAPAIAERLFLSAHTVRNHLKRIYRKLGVGSQTELIRFVRKL